MDWSLAINVTVIGIVLVFTMLLLLVLILYIFGLISMGVQKASNNRSDKALLALSEEYNHKDNSEIDSGDDIPSAEIVAVISAAVSSLYVGTAKKPLIKSVRKSGGKRSVWANAGIRENTRLF